MSIIIIITLLSGFPDNLKAFVLGTTGTITGGAVAVEPVELKDYVIGLIIFAALMVLLVYLVHALRTPRPQSWYPQLQDEGPDAEADEDMHLDRIKRELQNLRAAKNELPKKKMKKITKTPDIHELNLEHALRRINAQLHGYKKTPIVLEAPAGKSEWDESLKQVRQEIASVDTMKFRNVKIRKTPPAVAKTSETVEQRRLAKELQSLHQALEEEEGKVPHYFIRRCIPASREWQLANIKKRLRKEGVVQNKEELAEIERRLMKLYRVN